VKVAFVASEGVPYAKTGGLADVIGTLPYHLAEAGIDVSVFLPRYKGITCNRRIQKVAVDVGKTYEVEICRNERFFFVDHPPFFDRDWLYGTSQGDYPDNFERFTLFCKAVCAYLKEEEFDIVHCHDWQTGLIPLLLRDRQSSVKSVFTIHNLGYQGIFPGGRFSLLGLDGSYFTPEGIEYYGDINFLKAGIVYSDIVTTVSENYAREIQTPLLGFGLDGILRTRRNELVGIINGIDYQEWDPSQDTRLFAPYRAYSGKAKNKRRLLDDCALSKRKPLIGMVSRIA
jgi:starch synthase